MTNGKIQMTNESLNVKALNYLPACWQGRDLNYSFGFWNLGFGFRDYGK
jgi:hypothetical protein